MNITFNVDYKFLFTKGPELLLLLKPDPPLYTILDASDAYIQATLTQRNEIIGKSLFVVFPDNPDDPEANGESNLRRSFELAITKQQMHVMQIQKYDVPIPVVDGGGFEEKYWSPRNTPLFNEKKEILYLLHQVVDVTTEIQLNKKREKEINDSSKKLEEKSLIIRENEERINLILEALLKYTAMDFSSRLMMTDKGDELDAISVGLNSLIDELENNMGLLIQANQALEYANKELDSFSYSVSHDLRAPLRGINGYAQVLLEDYSDKLDTEGRNNLAVIMRNALKMGNLIDDLLTFSRTGKQSVSKAPLKMASVVNAIIHEQGNLNGKTTFDVKELSDCEGDYNMMVQVMTNLISNAIKYSSKKEKSLVEIGSYQKKDAMIYYVKDNGAGFDMKYYDKLFGVFQRLHAPSEFEGTGVGLALVQRIIMKHGGEIWAQGIPGEGATFSFSLPIKNNS